MPFRHRQRGLRSNTRTLPHVKRDPYDTERYRRKSIHQKASPGGTLKKNEKIKETVKNAATELTSVNEVLKQGKVPVQEMEQALNQNEDVEQKIAKAADDLNLVNVKLAEEVAERVVIETEL